jgi:myo-inositol-1(or 4)-monophosphatase
MELTLNELEEIQKFVVNLVQKAGNLILQGSKAILSSPQGVNEKKNSVDLVTEWDLRVQSLFNALEFDYHQFICLSR